MFFIGTSSGLVVAPVQSEGERHIIRGGTTGINYGLNLFELLQPQPTFNTLHVTYAM